MTNKGQFITYNQQAAHLPLLLRLQVMSTRAAQQALSNGRVVLVTDRATGLTELGVVCAPEEGGGGGAGGGKRAPQRAAFGLGQAPSAQQAAAGAGAGIAGPSVALLCLA